MGARSNPFSACFVQPGAIRWLTPDGGPSVAELARTLGGARAWQVVGAHGSGKSTLLAHLARELDGQGRAAVLIRRAHGGAGRVLTRGATVLLVDEWESLPRAMRTALRWLCRVRGAALVVACHEDAGLATLLRTHVTPAVVRDVVAEVAGEPFAAEVDLEALIARYQHDLREMLFALYDRYEARASDRR